MIRRRVILAALCVVLFGLGWWVGRGGASNDLYGNLDLFVEILQKVESNYVDPVDPHQLVDGAIKGMLRTLDPHSQYLDTKAYASLENVTHGSFEGIGIVVSMRDNRPTVIAPIEGSPAWEAGLQSGDVIVRIDGESTSGFTVEDTADRLRGRDGSSVTVSLRREGDPEERDVTLIRRRIETKSVPYAFVAGHGTGYLRIANFTEKTSAEVREALTKLRADGARSLVLDLRSDPGGLLDQAVDVAEDFIPKGSLVVYTRGRARGQDNRYYAAEPRPELRWPMVVLVDQGTASASEIVAGALQDLDRALIVGRTSFGKGSVQSVFPLAGRTAALKLTTALYYTPSGRSIHREGLPSFAANSGDDEGVGEAPAAPAPPDSVPVLRYHTADGRVVYGGGGITPDVVVTPDSLPPLAALIERRGLPFRFANRWVTAHPEGAAGAALSEAQWDGFVELLRSEKIAADPEALRAQRPLLERAVRRELARRRGGDAVAARIALEGDPVFQRALEVLGRARLPREVFAIGAAAPAPAADAQR
ncbi:MAG: hypothetical protein A2W00_15545 [Candidatus Eisenbacteria bacterium RBG_16_71_46]|nr:MAG: hypothetical protein A2W00_15545 [Candidatus Eisenbacteria bacterium RBG_16_71_46]